MRRGGLLLILVGLAVAIGSWIWSSHRHAQPLRPAKEADDASSRRPTLTGSSAASPSDGEEDDEGQEAEDLDDEQSLVRCRVVDAEGKPIAEARVGLLKLHHGGFIGLSDDKGRIEEVVGGAAEGQLVRLLVHAPGFAPSVTPWRALRGGEILSFDTLTLQPGRRIRGHVRRPSGAPVSDAFIKLEIDRDPLPDWWRDRYLADCDFTTSFYSDTDGSFASPALAPGPYRLRVYMDAPGDARIFEGLEPGGTPLEIVVPEVVDDVPVDPEPWTIGVELDFTDVARDAADPHVDRWNVNVRAGGRHVRTAQQGSSLSIDVRGKGPITLEVSARDRSWQPAVLANITRGEPNRRLRLRPGLTLEGTVSGPPSDVLDGSQIELSGFLLPDGTVSPTAPRRDEDWIRLVEKRTYLDAQGHFRFTGLLPGTLRLRSREPNLRLLTTGKTQAKQNGGPIVDTRAATANLRGELRRALELVFEAAEGFATEETHVVWRVEVAREGGWARVTEGEARLDPTAEETVHLDGSEGPHRLHVRTWGPHSGPYTRVLNPGERRVVFPLGPPSTLAGRVVTHDGRPVPHAFVELRRDVWGGYLWPTLDRPWREVLAHDPDEAVSDVDGRFTLSVPPEGRWRLTAKARGYAMADDPVWVEPKTRSAEIVVTPAQRITGRVLAPEPMHYRIAAKHAARETIVYVGVQRDGFFEVPGLLPGAYTLRTEPQEHEFDEGEAIGFGIAEAVQAGARGVRIEVGRGRSARLELVDAAGRALSRSDVSIVSEGVRRDVSFDGYDEAFVATGLGETPHTFVVRWADGTTSRIEARLGGTVRHTR